MMSSSDSLTRPQQLSLSCPSRIGGRGAKRDAGNVYPNIYATSPWPRRKQRTAPPTAMSLFEVSEALAAAPPPLTTESSIFDGLATDPNFDPAAAEDQLVLDIFGAAGAPLPRLAELEDEPSPATDATSPMNDDTAGLLAHGAGGELALLDALVAEVAGEPTQAEDPKQAAEEEDDLSCFFSSVVGEDYSANDDVLSFSSADSTSGEMTPTGGPPAAASAASDGRSLESLAEELAEHLQRTLEVPLPARPSSRNSLERKDWTAEEDETIRQAVLLHGCKWRKIAALLPGRSDDAVRNRWNRLKEGGSGSGGGGGSGGKLARRLSEEEGGAPSKPAPQRRPSREGPERVGWTRAEDNMIVSSVNEMGNRWHQIAKRLPERTEHAIRNRYHRLQTMAREAELAGRMPAGAPAALLASASPPQLAASPPQHLEFDFEGLAPLRASGSSPTPLVHAAA